MRKRAPILALALAALTLTLGCGDDDSPATLDAGHGADAGSPDAGDLPPQAPALRHELDDVPDLELAKHALQLLGAPVEGAQANCNGCHGMSRERIRSWASPLGGGAVPACLSDLTIATAESAKKMLDCLRLDPANPASTYVTARLGVFASAANLPWFEYLFRRAYPDAAPAQWARFKSSSLMPKPKSGHAPFTQAEFDVVAEWFQRGLPQLDELLGGAPPPSACTDHISPEVAAHVKKMAQSGWRALNVERQLLMFGCSGAARPRDCLASYPRASSTDFGASWESLAGATLRVLRTNSYSSSFWTRSSADGRFVAHGGASTDLGSTIIDLQTDRLIPAAAQYDPGFFPDDSAFVFQGTDAGTAVCSTSLLRSGPRAIRFDEPQCTSAVSVGLYQHVGAALEGGDYWAVNSDFVSDDGGHLATIGDPAAYFATEDTIVLTPMVNQGNAFQPGTPVTIPSPHEGDTVISPSARLLISRVAGDGEKQRGLRLRQLVTTHAGGQFGAEIPEIARYCTLDGGKPAFSYDERWIVMHHYVGDEDAVELGFTGANDPGFADYRSKGASNIYLVELTTGRKLRVTGTRPGQYALFPHFRSDGWIYFVVRVADSTTEYVVASDAALAQE